MLPSNLLPSSQITSKKTWILELAAAGRPNKEIASEVGASPEYVAKVKSEAKRRALQGRPPALLPPARPETRGDSTDFAVHHPAGSPLSGRSQTAIINLKETDENADVRKELWKKFVEKVANAEIIKETGLNPGIVWSEFGYFLTFTNRDPYALHKDAMDYLATRIGKVSDLEEVPEAYQKLVENYKANGYLTNREFFELLGLLSRIGFESGIDSVPSRKVRPPKGWIKPSCTVCGQPMSGVVVNPSTEIGKTALASVRRYHHAECRKEKDPATS